MKHSTVIIDYGMGNIGSITNIIRYTGGRSIASSDPEIISNADRLILPGVGSFDNGIKSLSGLGLVDAIRYAVEKNGSSVLGICLGMQLMLESSEEGFLKGLGLVPGKVCRFNPEGGKLKIRIPHMGWNQLEVMRQSRLFKLDDPLQRFYFVHSYFVECGDKNDIVGQTCYGNKFTSAFEKNNIIGVQFHPEKSHHFGMTLFRRFLEIE
jgi:imidazole glycerol-phosphate synthase subunit HisH